MIKPSEVAARARRLEQQNYEFRTFLKIHADYDELDSQFLKLHKELFANYDCSKCANCCRAYNMVLDEDEVKKVAKFLKTTKGEFMTKYLVLSDPDVEEQYECKHKPCPFLNDDGSCQIEDYKPISCKDYPFTDKPDRLSSMYSVIDHASVCPVVFEILERLKILYGFRSNASAH